MQSSPRPKKRLDTIFLALFATAALMLAAYGAANRYLSNAHHQEHEASMEALGELQALQLNLRLLRLQMFQHLGTSSPGVMQELREDIDRTTTKIGQVLTDLKQPRAQELFTRLVKAHADVTALHEDFQTKKAFTAMYDEAETLQTLLSAELDLLVDQRRKQSVEEMSREEAMSLSVTLVMTGLGLSLLAGGYALIRTQVTRPIARVAQYAGKVAAGDLNAAAPSLSTAEPEQLREAIEHMVARLKNRMGFSQGVLGGIPLPCFVLDPNGKVIHQNRALSRLFGSESTDMFMGRRGEEILGKAWSNGPVPDGGVTLDVSVLSRDTSERKTEATITSIYDLDGGLLGSFVLMVDKTELLEAVDKAQTALKARSEFLANMSHEIRTPLNGVLSAAELAMDLKDLAPEAERYLSIIETSGKTLLGVINDILDFSKMDAGRLEIEHAPLRPERILHEIAGTFAGRASQKGLELLIDLEPSCPGAVLGDALRVKQILGNLIGNAIKFTERGRVVAGLTCRPKPGGKDVALSFFVKDTGIGIPEAKLVAIFDPFAQADGSHSRRFGGTGLGLTICDRLARLMGGRVRASSVEGRGSTFTLELTLPSTGEEMPPRVMPDEIVGKRALIVDDCRESLDILDKLLTSFGLETVRASSGKEALALAAGDQAGSLAVAVLDWVMPGIDGLAVAKGLRLRYGRQLPMVMLTAFGKDLPAAEAGKAGITTVLQKPVSPSLLFDAIIESFGEAMKPAGRAREQLRERTPSTELTLAMEAVRGLNVLLAEDNATNQEIALSILTGAGVTVTVANDGREALEMVQVQDFDLVLMDVQMPRLNGYEATRAIRRLPDLKELPILAMTAHAMEGDEELCLKAGMNAHIPKPINRLTLFKTMARWAGDAPSRLGRDHEAGNPGGDAPDLDLESAVRTLGLDEDCLLDILSDFPRLNEHLLRDMAKSLELGDASMLGKAAHALKGAAGTVGALRLKEVSQAIEAAVSEDFVPENLDTLVCLARTGMSALEQEVARKRAEALHGGRKTG